MQSSFWHFSTFSNAQFDDQFYQPSKEMKPIENVNYSEFKIPVENDTISGIFMKTKRKPKATVLFFHGAAGNVSTYLFMTKPLVKAGYQVLMIDFRGYGKSTGKPTHQNIAEDGQKFVNYALSLKETHGKPFVISGASMGGQIATYLVKNNQDKVDGLVLDGVFSSFNAVAIHFAPQAENFLKNVKFPYSAEEDIKKINIPKLFIHSKGDKTIPIEMGKRVFGNGSEPKYFIEYEGDHLEGMIIKPQEIIANMDEIIK